MANIIYFVKTQLQLTDNNMMATEKKIGHKSPSNDQIPAELRQGVEKFALRSINLLILFGIWKNCLRSGTSPSMNQSIRRAITEVVVIIETHHFCQLHTKF